MFLSIILISLHVQVAFWQLFNKRTWWWTKKLECNQVCIYAVAHTISLQEPCMFRTQTSPREGPAGGANPHQHHEYHWLKSNFAWQYTLLRQKFKIFTPLFHTLTTWCRAARIMHLEQKKVNSGDHTHQCNGSQHS